MKRCFILAPDKTFLVRFPWRLCGSPHKMFSSSYISINCSETTAVSIQFESRVVFIYIENRHKISVRQPRSSNESAPVLFITTPSNLFPCPDCIAETQTFTQARLFYNNLISCSLIKHDRQCDWNKSLASNVLRHFARNGYEVFVLHHTTFVYFKVKCELFHFRVLYQSQRHLVWEIYDKNSQHVQNL